jgi:hypothetical protein
MNLNQYFLRFFLSLMIVLFNCNKNSTEPTGPAPDIPPIESFVMDFSDFASADTSSISNTFAKQNLTYQHWWWAAFNVGFWNAFITIGMVVPTAAFLATLNTQPEWNPEGEYWVWTKTFVAGAVQHTAELRGSLTDSGSKWEMYISKNNAFQNFQWYSGEANLPLTEGSWVMNNSPNNPTNLIRIEWHRNIQDGSADIKYINIVPNGPENGGYIFYGIRTNNTYNAYYDIYNKGQENHTDIEWNPLTKEGHVKDPHHFGDEEWHCWDYQLMDTNCM